MVSRASLLLAKALHGNAGGTLFCLWFLVGLRFGWIELVAGAHGLYDPKQHSERVQRFLELIGVLSKEGSLVRNFRSYEQLDSSVRW